MSGVHKSLNTDAHSAPLHSHGLVQAFVVLLFIETTDVIFAVDSIPAILAITSDHFIVYTSNVFAIPGLRALSFALAGIMGLFHYLHYGLSVILVFVGGKMVMVDFRRIAIEHSLMVVMGILVISVIASKLLPRTRPDAANRPPLIRMGAAARLNADHAMRSTRPGSPL